MHANPNVVGRAKTKDCRMIPGHSSPRLSRPAIFLSVSAFFQLECPSRVHLDTSSDLLFKSFCCYGKVMIDRMSIYRPPVAYIRLSFL